MKNKGARQSISAGRDLLLSIGSVIMHLLGHYKILCYFQLI